MAVSNVTATAPIASSGGVNPNISLATPLSAAYGGTGQTKPSLMLGWYNVKDYGAVGDGVTDDSSAIQGALAAATSNNGCLYFPTGNYYYNSPTPIKISTNIILTMSVFATGNAIITGGPATTDCFVITGQAIGNGGSCTPWVLPSVQNFTNGAGVLCTDTPTTVFVSPEIHIAIIFNCHDGILISAGNTTSGGCIGTWIVFVNITQCVNGIRFQSRSSSKDGIQSAQIVGGLIYKCNNGIVFDGQACTTTSSFTIPAIGASVTIPVNRPQFSNGDPVVVGLAATYPAFMGMITAGAGTTSLTVKVTGYVPASSSYAGLVMPTGMGVNGFYSTTASCNSVNCAINGIGGTGQTGISILGGVWDQILLNMGTSFFGFGPGAGSTTISANYGQFWNSCLTANWFYAPNVTYGCMAAFSSPTPNFNNGNFFGSTYTCMAPDTYAANTGPNTSGTFNGGVPIPFPSFRVSFVCPPMTAGQVADFYVYSWFTTAAPSGVRFSVDNFALAPVVVQCCEDESGTPGTSGQRWANEIHIRLLAVGTVTGGSVLYGRVDVGV